MYKSLTVALELAFKARVGKKHDIVIPKAIAERLNLHEGSKVIIKATESSTCNSKGT
ncbi:MAG: AbrB/MazE/SpoVT family DNA-binding domain-containing protein [Thermoproteota archaeon]